MDFQEWGQMLADQFREIFWLQWLGLILGVAEVILARNNKIALYPAGIAASAISIYLLWEAGLFGECILSFYYIVMSIYGWWYWIKKKHVPPVEISYSTRSEWKTVITIVVAGYLLLYIMLRYFTPSTVPHWDALVSATAWAGMWLLARRKIENWILLNISNAMAIPLLFYKGLALYALLTIFLFVVAVQGYFIWKKIVNRPKQNELS
ncbi:MAG TPA: nicotinamide riboside transporter PnuC [Flavitalea sp.]|nr:nicotinamide riboside transporter PnuC [Flavitalea sp.]HTF31433.1 nicotinamide riboside transporter PnuC [Flavitalea sp.]